MRTMLELDLVELERAKQALGTKTVQETVRPSRRGLRPDVLDGFADDDEVVEQRVADEI